MTVAAALLAVGTGLCGIAVAHPASLDASAPAPTAQPAPATGVLPEALLAAADAATAPVHTPAALPDAQCARGGLPERTQGRVPSKDYADGRAAKGYRCNTTQVGHFGKTGGFKVLRYVDGHGHTCAYYDTTLLFPTDAANNAAEGLGVYVLDMSDPAHPRHTATLSTPAMLSPHESLLLNKKRGLLVADMGSPAFDPGFVDVYSVKGDCRHPVLDSSLPLGIFGHESGFAPDGKTFYVSSTGGQTFDAVDLSNPKAPKVLFAMFGVVFHGMRVSDDGNRVYVAEIGGASLADNINLGQTPGLAILDVSQIQARKPNPKVPVVSRLSWPTVSIPQVPIPMTIHGHRYLFEVDEYTRHTVGTQAFHYDANDPVGAARIINIDDDRHPRVVANLRLAVNQPKQRAGAQRNDPGAGFAAQGYAGHYCSIPREVDPKLVACSFIASGERIFDIRDPFHPREVGYFNRPAVSGPVTGGYAMSQAAWDLKHHQVWYSDGRTGLWVLHLANRIWPKGL